MSNLEPGKERIQREDSQKHAPDNDTASEPANLPRIRDIVPGGEKSFQADIVDIGDGRIAKMYRQQNLYGLVDFANDVVRNHVMNLELSCLQNLSPGMQPRIEEVENERGEKMQALTMLRLDPGDFLDERIRRRENLPTEKLQELARIVAKFHFNPEACPKIPGPITNFLFDQLFDKEQKLLTSLLNSDVEMTTEVKRWFTVFSQVIQHYAEDLNATAEQLQEPVRGHGDLKSLNTVFARDGSVYVIDVAPYELWQINLRRMDVAFLRSELTLIGRAEEADVFWREYDSEYKRIQGELGRGYEAGSVTAKAVDVLDLCAEFYRYVIFYRLTFLGVDPERAPRCIELLQDVVDRATKTIYQ